MTVKEKVAFFSKENLHRAGWAILIGLLSFLGGILFNKIHGPQKVIIDASNSAALPINVIVQTPPQKVGATTADIQDLTQAIKGMQNSNETAIKNRQVIALADEVRKLRDSLASQSRPPAASASVNQPLPGAQAKPLFRFPSKVKGYQPASLFGIKDSSCPPRNITPDATLRIVFRLVDTKILSSGSPLFVRVDRIKADGNLIQAVETLYDLHDGINDITIAPPRLEPAEYRVSYGFYMRDEIDEEFPKFYSRECKFNVQASAK